MADASHTSIQVVERTDAIPASADAIYAWHERPGALEHLMPPWREATVVQRTGGLSDGARTVLSVPLGPFRVRWVARHRNTVPGRQFVDEMVSGPMAHWVHLHKMLPISDTSSSLHDRVEFTPPLGPLGALAAPWIRRRIDRMLRYRHEILRDEFAQGMPAAPLTVAVTGATGFVGAHLIRALTTAGHTVRRIVRHDPGTDDIVWHPARGELDPRQLDGVDAVIHLAGASISRRWTREQKQRIRESRRTSTSLLARSLARLDRKPAVLVSMSAVGYYGSQGDTVLDEQAPPGDDFLADVCQVWEASADPAREAGIRVVHPRLGIVLSPSGGALPLLALPIRLGVGGRHGSGNQWLSWVALDDVLGALRHAIEHDELSGPVNLVGRAERNREFIATLARVLHRPAAIPVPAFALRAVAGEMADGLLLASQRVEAAALGRSSYRMRYPDLEGALRHVLGTS
ncbi:MAG TPA: TIGR01777 family oxidoreductase [Gemmatimonadales bacterium]|nr:TIGR01777 family oxidoreductase [Gemmatimonadales bacterium]